MHFMTGPNKPVEYYLSTGFWRRLKCCLEKLTLSLIQYCSRAFIWRADFVLIFLMFLIRTTKWISVRILIADIVKRIHCIIIIEWKILKGNDSFISGNLFMFKLAFDVTLVGTIELRVNVSKLLTRVDQDLTVGTFKTVLMIGTIFWLHYVLSLINRH